MRHTLAGPVARAKEPGWFWAAGTNTARPVCVGRGSSGLLVTETSMPYPIDVRPAAEAGGAQ